MSSCTRTPPIPVLDEIPDDLTDDASCRHLINAYAHTMLHPTLGTDRSTYIAVDVWIWYSARRAADPDFLNTPDSFRTGIRRKLFDELRKANRELERYDAGADIDQIAPERAGRRTPQTLTPSEVFEQGETIWNVQRAIARLPAQMQRVIRFYEMDGYTADDVGAELGITAKKVRVIRGEAIAQLRVLLAEYADVGEKAA